MPRRKPCPRGGDFAGSRQPNVGFGSADQFRRANWSAGFRAGADLSCDPKHWPPLVNWCSERDVEWKERIISHICSSGFSLGLGVNNATIAGAPGSCALLAPDARIPSKFLLDRDTRPTYKKAMNNKPQFSGSLNC